LGAFLLFYTTLLLLEAAAEQYFYRSLPSFATPHNDGSSNLPFAHNKP
jgi:hypothetical protein